MSSLAPPQLPRVRQVPDGFAGRRNTRTRSSALGVGILFGSTTEVVGFRYEITIRLLLAVEDFELTRTIIGTIRLNRLVVQTRYILQ